MGADTDLIRLDGVSMKYRLAKQRHPSFKEYALHWVRGALVYEDLWALSEVTLRIGSGESIGWSVLAIALALGFLVWGIRAEARVWRIGSLVLMLAAVGKVFLVDASGLEGLLRIASFLALGFSLIGLGWLYSRYLRSDPQAGYAGAA